MERCVAVGPWKIVPAPAEDPEEGEYNYMLRLISLAYGRDLEEDEDGENYEDGDNDEEEDMEVFANGPPKWRKKTSIMRRKKRRLRPRNFICKGGGGGMLHICMSIDGTIG
jgi:hypothetical protein